MDRFLNQNLDYPMLGQGFESLSWITLV